MVIKLNKNVDITLNSDFREQINSNFDLIEKAINNGEYNLTLHKTTESPAHTSEQITHNDETVKSVLDYLRNKWANMILGSNGDGINELKDSRVANDGVAYPTLAERLAADYAAYMVDSQGVKVEIETALNTIKNLLNTLDILNQEFGYVLRAKTFQNNVMQHFYIDNNFDYVYIVQADTSINGYNIHRLKFNGEYVNTMVCKNAGHGTHNGYYHVGNSLYIISHWYDAEGGHKLVKIKYNAGTYDYGSGMTDVFKGTNNAAAYITVSINEREDLILYRLSETVADKLVMKIEVRKLSEVLADKENIIASFTIPANLTQQAAEGENIMQGVAIGEGAVYWLTGDSTGSGNKLLTQFDYTGNIVAQKAVIFGDDERNQFIDDFFEPQGLQYYNEPNGDKDALLIGMTTGVDRTHRIYGIFELGAYEQLQMRINRYGGSGSGLTKDLPADVTTIASIVEQGTYYFNQTLCEQLTDFPHYVKDAGWWLFNTPQSGTGYILQTFIKNSPTRQTTTYSRLITPRTNVVAAWTKYATSGVYESVSSKIQTLAEVTSPGEYYVTSAMANSLSDFPEKSTVAGWFLFVEGNQSNGGALQRLVRNSQSGASMTEYKRVIEPNATNYWYKFEGTKV